MTSRIASLMVPLAVSLVFLGCSSDGDGGTGHATKTITLPGNVPLEIVSIPPGTFMMGEQDSGDTRESPPHQVTLTQGFWLGKYEVTKAQWQAVMETGPWSWQGLSYVLDDPGSPVIYVDWDGVQEFIAKLNAQTDESFRLPSEAEWEYACRAGTTTRFSYGDDPEYSHLSNYAWYKDNSRSAREEGARGVGKKLPNPWGLYDMHGNVFEWCQDWYEDYPSGPVTNPTGAASGTTRVSRGGSWDEGGYNSRSAHRRQSSPKTAAHFFGFRLAMDGTP